MAKPLPPIDELFDRFYVDSTSPSGLRYAKDCGKKKKGSCVGFNDGKGYYRTNFNSVMWGCHRIVHALRTGADNPEMTVDHIDRNSLNNHPFNLRWATAAEQSTNTRTRCKAGLRGVRQKKYGKYEAFITRNRKQTYLGVFDTAEQAHQAYLNAAQTYRPS